MRKVSGDDGGLRERAKEWRIEQELSQMDVSNLLGLSMNSYGAWERGGSENMARKNVARLKAIMEGKPQTPESGLREVTCAICYELTVLSVRGRAAKFCIHCGKQMHL